MHIWDALLVFIVGAIDFQLGAWWERRKARKNVTWSCKICRKQGKKFQVTTDDEPALTRIRVSHMNSWHGDGRRSRTPAE